MATTSHVWICEYCGASCCLPRGGIPGPCGGKNCKDKKPKWRIALATELTRSDRRFLRSLRILAE